MDRDLQVMECTAMMDCPVGQSDGVVGHVNCDQKIGPGPMENRPGPMFNYFLFWILVDLFICLTR